MFQDNKYKNTISEVSGTNVSPKRQKPVFVEPTTKVESKDEEKPKDEEPKKVDSNEGYQVAAGDIVATGSAVADNGSSGSETYSYEPFDFFGDPLFQAYQSMYMGNAQKAMKGAIADSALLTGGYGNSFGQVAGQQAYADVMDDFYTAIPSLFSAAYSVYDSERAAAKAAWDEDQAKIAEATEKAQGEYDAAVDSEQDRAYDYYAEKIKSGEMTWEEAQEALLGITYTDHNGKEVSLFTEEDAAEYEDKYNANVAAAEAAETATRYSTNSPIILPRRHRCAVPPTTWSGTTTTRSANFRMSLTSGSDLAVKKAPTTKRTLQEAVFTDLKTSTLPSLSLTETPISESP